MESTWYEYRQAQGLLLSGFKVSDKFIADKFGVSESTIRADKEKAYGRLGTDCLSNALMLSIARQEITIPNILCVYYTL